MKPELSGICSWFFSSQPSETLVGQQVTQRSNLLPACLQSVPCNFPLRKAALTSRWWEWSWRQTARLHKMWMEVSLTTGKRTWSKSILGIWVNPHATNQTLYHSMVPLVPHLSLKTSLELMAFQLGGRVETSSKVPVWRRDLISSETSPFQLLTCGEFKASERVYGSSVVCA